MTPFPDSGLYPSVGTWPGFLWTGPPIQGFVTEQALVTGRIVEPVRQLAYVTTSHREVINPNTEEWPIP